MGRRFKLRKTELQKLPVGIQAFEKLREGGYTYVDKTRYLLKLIENGTVYFLSRPRRFGKSLMVSTFDALFSGKKELFKGLAAEEFFDRPDYKISPVLRFDMSALDAEKGFQSMEDALILQIITNAKRHGVTISSLAIKYSHSGFRELMQNVAAAYGPVVILVDEYDKPMLDVLHDSEEVDKARRLLRSFYTQIKSSDDCIRFVFFTGITKFSRAGVFSALNNLEDISMDADYASIAGYTEEELLLNFSGYIDKIAEIMKISREELVVKIRDYYDGFSFDGFTKLYNPFSTLSFLKNPKFLNYWFISGTPEFIARFMKDKNLTVEQFQGFEVSRDFASFPGEIDTATAASFLYQAGYLSLRPGSIEDYSLDYPNHEVLTAMSFLLIGNILGDSSTSQSSGTAFKQCLIHEDKEGIKEELNQLLAAIPYDDYMGAAKTVIKIKRLGIDAGEWLYRSTLLSYLYGIGLDVEAETHTHRGRADLIIKFKGQVWVLEIKIAKGEARTKEAARDALAQIKEKYAARYIGAKLLGLAIDDEKRQITHIEFDEASKR